MMTVDERIRYLLRAATRAEGEGDLRVARAFRRMADELQPLDAALRLPRQDLAYGYCHE